VLGLETVLRSIQSLLAAKPFNLEPGFEDEPDQARSQVYNAKVCIHMSTKFDITSVANLTSQIKHESLRLTVITPLERAYGIRPPPPSGRQNQGQYQDQYYEPGHPDPALSEEPVNLFLDTYKRRFMWYLESYKMAIQQGLKDGRARAGHPFPQAPFEYPGNYMIGFWDYEGLEKRLEVLELRIKAETNSWAIEGRRLERKEQPLAASLHAQRDQIVRQLTQRTDGMVTLELVDDNPFLWRLIYHGRPMTQFDGGVLKIKIFISPNHPAEQPRVFLETPLYHVRVSPQNVLIYLPLQADEMSRHIDGIISSLEEEKPPVNPMMTVNPEASALCWGSEADQRQYRRNLRRSVAATLE
jgi:ubiquitin-conjugating enzyme E2 Z